MKFTSEKFERIIKFRPAFDRRNSNPAHNYGIHCVDMIMGLKGPKGAISFTIFTGWFLPQLYDEWKTKGTDISILKASGADLAYHTFEPKVNWQNKDEPSSLTCEWLDGKPCWADGSALQADILFKKFVSEGEDAVWQTLEYWYHEYLDSVNITAPKIATAENTTDERVDALVKHL